MKLENILLDYIKNLNTQIQNKDDVVKNEDKIKIIIDIQNYIKLKQYQKAKDIILDLVKDNNILNFPPPSPSPANFINNQEKTRDWNIDIDDENVEIYDGIQSISLMFLDSIKKKIGTQIK